jgi:hypothetical protein
MKKNKARLITEEEVIDVRRKMLATLPDEPDNLRGFLFSIEDVLRFFEVSGEDFWELCGNTEFPGFYCAMDDKIYFPEDKIIAFIERREDIYKYWRKMHQYEALKQQTGHINDSRMVSENGEKVWDDPEELEEFLRKKYGKDYQWMKNVCDELEARWKKKEELLKEED